MPDPCELLASIARVDDPFLFIYPLDARDLEAFEVEVFPDFGI